jgi:hypothetical protein
MENKEENLIKPLLIFISIILILVGLFYYFFQYKKPDPVQNEESKEVHVPSQSIETDKEDTNIVNDQETQEGKPEEIYISEWDSYTSNRFGFAFDNPGGFFIDRTNENYSSDEGHIGVHEMKNWNFITKPTEPSGGPASIGISVYLNSENLGLLEWAEKNVSHSNYNGTHSDIIVGGNKAIRYKWEGMESGETVLLLNPEGDLVISINMFVTDSLITPYESILESFRFLD